MVYLAVVLEKAHIIDSGLDPQNQAELVVQLNRNWSHRMLDPRPFDANVETVPHFAFELGAEFAAENRCDVVGLDGVNSGARQVLVHSLQVRLFAENDIGGVLALVCAPVISSREIAINRTVPARELVQLSVDTFGCPSIGDPLGAWPVRDLNKGVVDEPIFDSLLTDSTGLPVMAVAVDLQPAG